MAALHRPVSDGASHNSAVEHRVNQEPQKTQNKPLSQKENSRIPRETRRNSKGAIKQWRNHHRCILARSTCGGSVAALEPESNPPAHRGRSETYLQTHWLGLLQETRQSIRLVKGSSCDLPHTVTRLQPNLCCFLQQSGSGRINRPISHQRQT